MNKKILFGLLLASGVIQPALADQVILDDLIVDGSICVGMDCVNGESFGFDTIRLKENNLRIRFTDTSSTSSFPSNDWQITANDSANGGANKFSIDDIDGGRTPFTIEARAPSHSLYVDDGGRIGFGTSTPVVELHTKDGNTPTLRLEQDGSSGFTPQTWDVAGNEANFFIRDATNGSRLPFRIKPGAPTDSIFIAADGKVGLGVNPPGNNLHIKSGSVAGLRLENTSGTITWDINNDSDEIKFFRTDDTVPRVRIDKTGQIWTKNSFNIQNTNTDNTQIWRFLTVGNTLRLSAKSTGGPEVVIEPTTGNMTLRGTLTENSSRLSKTDINRVDEENIINKLAKLEISEWRYKNDSSTHIGPMAEDFYGIFGYGANGKGISPRDMAGIALAAFKSVNVKLAEKDEQLANLKKGNAALMKRLEQLESTVMHLGNLRGEQKVSY